MIVGIVLRLIILLVLIGMTTSSSQRANGLVGGTFVATVRNLLAKCVTHVPSPCVKRALKRQTSSLSEELKASVRHA